jgi:hypothetical protein
LNPTAKSRLRRFQIGKSSGAALIGTAATAGRRSMLTHKVNTSQVAQRSDGEVRPERRRQPREVHQTAHGWSPSGLAAAGHPIDKQKSLVATVGDGI